MAEKAETAEAFSGGQIRNVLRVAGMTAAEAMYPISEVRCFPSSADMAELVDFRRENEQRLIPLYDKAPDRVSSIAALESWDLLDAQIRRRDVRDYLGQMRTVDQDMRVSDVIGILHQAPNLTLIVTDKESRALGLITLRLLVRGTLGVAASPLTDRLQTENMQGRAMG